MYYVSGYASEALDVRGFRAPVFQRNVASNVVFAQEIDDFGNIDCFSEIEISIDRFPILYEKTFRIGDPACYVYLDRNKEVTCGTLDHIRHHLISIIYNESHYNAILIGLAVDIHITLLKEILKSYITQVSNFNRLSSFLENFLVPELLWGYVLKHSLNRNAYGFLQKNRRKVLSNMTLEGLNFVSSDAWSIIDNHASCSLFDTSNYLRDILSRDVINLDQQPLSDLVDRERTSRNSKIELIQNSIKGLEHYTQTSRESAASVGRYRSVYGPGPNGQREYENAIKNAHESHNNTVQMNNYKIGLAQKELSRAIQSMFSFQRQVSVLRNIISGYKVDSAGHLIL